MRIQKALAHLGLGSRRACEKLVAEGRVTLRGKVLSIGESVEAEELPQLMLDGELVGRLPAKIYLLMNKPAGYVTTVSDPQGRPTVMDLLKDENLQGEQRVYPVGRLDRQTLGVLLFTNDGELAHRLLHPSSGVEKHYRARVEGRITEAALQELRAGPDLDDGPTQPPKSVSRKGQVVELVIKEGRKRQVRRMLKEVKLYCKELERLRFGNLSCQGLPRGKTRTLTENELRELKRLIQR